MRDALYEAPGPKTRVKVFIGTFISVVAIAALLSFVVYRFWVTGQLSSRYWELFSWRTTWIYLGKGLLGTFQVALTAGLISLVLGMLLMLGRTSHFRLLSAICGVFTNFFRGVPSLGFKMDSFWMLTIPISLAASGVLAEVFRAGVNAVPRGQTEAGLSIGLTRWKVKSKIVLPQAIRFVIPSLISQLVVVVKDTALAYVVTFPDLMQNAQVLRTNYDALVSTYLVVAVIYILINYLINKASVYASHRMGVKIIR